MENLPSHSGLFKNSLILIFWSKERYTNLYGSVEINGKLSPAFKIGRDIKQGYTLTPIL